VRHKKEDILADYLRTYQKILTSSKQEVPDKNLSNSFNDFFCLAADDYKRRIDAD
jgi:hypothetical protein